MSPACRRHQEQLRATHASWIRENNTRLLKSMFRSGIVAARQLELFQPLTKWPLDTSSVLRQQLCSQRLPFSFWRRIVTNAEWKLSTTAGIKLVDLELTVKRTKMTARLRTGILPERSSWSDKLVLQAKGGSKIGGGGEAKDAPTTIDLEKLKKDCNKYETILLGGVVEAEQLTTTMKDVELDASIIEALEDMTMLPLQQPEQFQYGLLAKARMAGALLFGPPGTGKTLLARAIAQRRSVHVLEVSGADVHQKYVGEAEKYVRAIFSLGRKLSPCVVFIDEADSIFCSRSSDMNRAYRNVVNGFLREWDGLSTSTGTDIAMLVATNRPFDLDSAILRRLPRRLFLDLPSCHSRQKILEIMLQDEQLADSVDLPSIATATNSFSGSDLKNLCIAAALSAVREGVRVSEGDESIISTTKRTLTSDHFVKALADTSPSTDVDMVAKIRKFNKEFGDFRDRQSGAISKVEPNMGDVIEKLKQCL